MFDIHESSNPYFVGIDRGIVYFAVDQLMVNAATGEQKIVTEVFTMHDFEEMTEEEFYESLHELTEDDYFDDDWGEIDWDGVAYDEELDFEKKSK